MPTYHQDLVELLTLTLDHWEAGEAEREIRRYAATLEADQLRALLTPLCGIAAGAFITGADLQGVEPIDLVRALVTIAEAEGA